MSESPTLEWYIHRLGRMSPSEMAWRVRERSLRRTWGKRQARPGRLPEGPAPGVSPAGERRFRAVLPPGTDALVPADARAAIITAADRLLKGEWEIFGVVRNDLCEPDWFYDPVTGYRSDPGRYAFRINQRSEEEVGNVKQVWELSRLQHLTLLAAAWYLTGDDRYAQRAADQLRSWWAANPFLSGVNWTSGIEIGIRLMNFAWIRRLLDSWPGASDLFERNELARWQIWWHQTYLEAFPSRGSSANNHQIAEAAGQLTAGCAFPWFRESGDWRRSGGELLERSLRANTFPSGINRELATDYHGFVFELGAFAAAEAAAAGHPVSDPTWTTLRAMADCLAALVDDRLQPPRQGDSDEGLAVLLDAPAGNRWPALLAIGGALFGAPGWWPGAPASGGGGVLADAGSVLVGALASADGRSREPAAAGDRPAERPSRFPDAGITILRTRGDDHHEIWCRCDGGPHGFGSLAAHAHADALSVEVRYGGVEILADPGTYCYHGEPEWRSYFRSTIAHNTAEIGGRSQSAEGGPFMWLRQAQAWELEVPSPDLDWIAEHDGYASLSPQAWHRRSVRLDPAARGIDITDVIDGGDKQVRLAFHLGPLVRARLDGPRAVLTWPASPVPGEACLELPGSLDWTAHRGETSPILGWYSPGLGQREPTTTLIGTGQTRRDRPLITRLRFSET
ncbi:MAG TPA: alginate lyase family protein [Trebonia sp.]|jgi:hypothetical protein